MNTTRIRHRVRELLNHIRRKERFRTPFIVHVESESRKEDIPFNDTEMDALADALISSKYVSNIGFSVSNSLHHSPVPTKSFLFRILGTHTSTRLREVDLGTNHLCDELLS